MSVFRLIGFCAALLAVAFMPACSKRTTSPLIACAQGGTNVTTVFTFDSFKATLEAEHGQVEAEANVRLRSRSLEVRFTPLPDGRLLAQQVTLFPSGRPMAPALLFGLTNAPPDRAQPPSNGSSR
jgi:hypothetical protein